MRRKFLLAAVLLATSFISFANAQDEAAVSAYSGVHQFCRVGRQAFVGGYSVVTKDALPYGKTVGNRACNYGANTLGLQRRGFSGEAIAAIRAAYRVLLQSHLNTSAALARLEQEGPVSPEVRVIIEFIRGSKRGVILKRRSRFTSHDEGE